MVPWRSCCCPPSRSPGDGVPLTTRSLDVSTWDAFVELVERNNGIYGGCWCIVHHPEYERRVSDPRALKQQLVNAGRAQAALVFDEAGVAPGWCQYGRRDELLLKHKRGYEQEPPPRASWRIACIFVDKRHRRHGVARAALAGALAQIASAGAGWWRPSPRPRAAVRPRTGSCSAQPSNCSRTSTSPGSGRSASTPGS